MFFVKYVFYFTSEVDNIYISWVATKTFEYPLFLFQLSVRGKNKKEKLGGFFKTITKSADEVLLSNHKVSTVWLPLTNAFNQCL